MQEPDLLGFPLRNASRNGPSPTSIIAGWARKAICVAAAILALASYASAQQRPVEAESDIEFRQKIERHIQKCIREKLETPEICRLSAYATALAAGFPPAEAARITGYRSKEDRRK